MPQSLEQRQKNALATAEARLKNYQNEGNESKERIRQAETEIINLKKKLQIE